MGRYEAFPFSSIQKIKLIAFPFEAKPGFTAVENPAWNSRVTHFRSMGIHRDIVMLGDSITAGGEWNELFPSKKIANRGIGGDTVSGILKRLDEVQNKKPLSVFILAGINDFRDGRDIDSVFNDYKRIVESLHGSGITVFVQSTIIPGWNTAEEGRRRVVELNERLHSYCNTANIKFIDLNSTLAKNGALDPRFTFDGIHLNGAGYKAWAKILSSYI